MRKIRINSTIPIIMLIVLAAMTIFPITAGAEKNGTDCGLLIDCRTDRVSPEGMNWKIYLVGRLENEGFVFSDGFAECGADITPDMNADKTRKAADTLADFANKTALRPNAESTVGADKKTRFDSLEAGYYLLVGEPLKIKNGKIIPMASLVNFDGKFKTVLPKLEIQELPDSMFRTSGGMDDNFSVAEKVPDSGSDADTGGSFYGRKTSSGDVSTSVSDRTGSDSSSYTNEGAPQTGQLWWPVPLLSVGGLVFIAFGVRINNRRNETENDEK